MLQAGHILQERYQLHTKLGQDASRQTWLAQDLNAANCGSVVVKLLALSPEMQWDECKLFEREAQVLQHLTHPYIPHYYDYFVLDNHPGSRFTWFGLVQSHIPGKSLQQCLQEGYRFTEADVIQIAIDILHILIYLHELNPPVLHRDIKPSNLIWGDDRHIYLVDFGAVQDQAALDGATFTIVGTYGYVPMEQFGGRAVPASDLYALGATLIHLLTGVAPADLPQRDRRIQFTDPISLDLGLINWISKLVEPDLTERFGTAREALFALNERDKLSSPLLHRKPIGSQIQLKKSANRLEVNLPRRGGKVYRVLFLVSILVPTLLLLSNYLFLVNIEIGLSSIFFFSSLTVSLLLILLYLLRLGFEQNQLTFDRTNFELKRKLFGICYQRHRGKTSSILKVYEQQDKAGGAAKGITIELWNRKLTTNPLATIERDWLIGELEDWLGLNFWKRESNSSRT